MDSPQNENEVLPRVRLFSRGDAVFFVIAFVFVYSQLFQLPFTPIYFEGDNMVSVSNAMRMLDGEVIYRDFFHLTPPGTELIYAFLFKIFGIKIWLLNIIIVFLGLAQTALIWFFSRKILSGISVYLPATIFLVIGFRQFGIDGSYRLFSVIFVLIAVAVLIDRRSLGKLVIAGCLCGLASFFVQTRGIVGIGGISIFLIWENYRNGFNIKLLVRDGLALAVSFVATVIITQSYFLWQAGFDNYYFSLVEFLQKHYRHDPLANSSAYLSDIPNFEDYLRLYPPVSAFSRYARVTLPSFFYYLLIPLIYLAFLLFRWWRNTRISSLNAYPKLVLLCVVGIFLTLGVSAPTSNRFYQVAIPGLVILVWFCQQIRVIQRALPFGLILLSLIGASYIVQRQIIPKRFLDMPAGYSAFLSEPVFDRYAWIGTQTQPGESLYEARHPSYYFPFHLKNPTPLYLVRDSEYTPEFQVNAVVKALEKDRPRLIIWPRNWSKSAEMRAPGDHLESIWQFVKTNYEIKFVFIGSDDPAEIGFGDIEVWELKH